MVEARMYDVHVHVGMGAPGGGLYVMGAIVSKVVACLRVMTLKVVSLSHMGRDLIVSPQAACRD